MRTRFRAAHGRIEALRNPRSLGAKLVLILTVIGAGGSIAITLLLAAIITPSFNRLETKSIDGHVERTRAALHEYASKVESAVRDYGDWTSSYDYMGHPTRAFEAESFSPLAMENLGVNGMAYVGTDERIVIARWRGDGADDPGLRAAMIGRIGRIDLRRALGKNNSTSFYVRFGAVVAAVGVAEVRRSDGSGTPRGFVLMARQITSSQLSGLLQLGAKLDLAHVADRDRITASATTMRIAVPIYGADRHAVASAVFSVPRELSVLGRRMLLLAVGGSTLLLLIVLVMLRRMIDRLVLRPLARVESHMQVVRASGSLGLLADEGRQDEIGALGTSFNAMLSQLRDLREQIEAQSFALGRSESAVAVMHNVRNALNPISTILSQGIAQTPPVDRAMLERAVTELTHDDLPPARRGKLVAFLSAAIEAEANDRARRRGELEVGREAMAHVLEIIGAQQRAAHERPDLEVCDVSEILARNATIARYSGDLSIAFSFPAKPHRVMASRVILSQVVGNLLGNAAEAIAAKGTRSGTITATITEEGGETRIAIRDDGEGFESANAPTFFQRGFSTRPHKSGGLGLHWCANAMGAMGGALRLESEGRGRGAVAILTLAGVEDEARVAA